MNRVMKRRFNINQRWIKWYLNTEAHVPTRRYGQYQMDQIAQVLGGSTESDRKAVLASQRRMFSNKFFPERG